MRADDVSGSFRLTGQVVDADGDPCADVEVRLKPGDRRTITDARGAFAFDELESRRFWVSARTGDLYAGPAVVRVAESTEPVHLALQLGTTLVVRVTADRAPVVGATVALKTDGLSATTNAHGVATLSGLPPGYHDGPVHADGWAPAFIGMFLGVDPGGRIERRVTLRPGARVEGIVLGPGDAPIPDTEIVVWRALEGSFVAETRSAADGTWRIEAMEAGQFRAVAFSDAYRTAADQLLECDGRTPQREVVLRVDVAAELSGMVVDQGGQPVPGAHLEANLRDAWGGKRTVTDDRGHFELRGLAPGEYHVDAWTTTRASAPRRIDLERGQPAELRLVVDNARVAGTVVDDRGEPVMGASVRATPCGIYVPYRLDTPTDSRGRFDFGPLQLGDYDLHVSLPGVRLRNDDAPVARVRSGDSDVRIVLEPPGRLIGRVLLDGSAMPYFGVLLTRGRDALKLGVHDDHGRFSLPVPPGTWDLELLGPGTARARTEDIAVGRGEVIDLGDLAMQRGQRISGHVRDPRGAPVASVRVRVGYGADLHSEKSQLERWFEGAYETITNAEGAYVFDGIAAGHGARTISAVCSMRGASRAQPLPADDAALDLVLLPSGTVEGIVESGGHHRFVDLVHPAEPPRARWLGTRRDFRFDEVPAGDYDLVVHHRDGPSSTTKVTVIADQCTSVTVAG